MERLRVSKRMTKTRHFYIVAKLLRRVRLIYPFSARNKCYGCFVTVDEKTEKNETLQRLFAGTGVTAYPLRPSLMARNQGRNVTTVPHRGLRCYGRTAKTGGP